MIQRAARSVDRGHVFQESFLRALRHAQPPVVVDYPPFVQYFFLQVLVHVRPVVVALRSEDSEGRSPRWPGFCVSICVIACHPRRAVVRKLGVRSPYGRLLNDRSIHLIVLLRRSWLLAEQRIPLVLEQGSKHTPAAVRDDVAMVNWIHRWTSSESSPDECFVWVRR